MSEMPQNIPEKLPENRQSVQDTTPENTDQATVISLEARRQFSGPIPPPDVLAEYDSLLPGLAERIVQMAEQEQKERFALAHERFASLRRTQYLGFSFGAATLISSLYLIAQGEPTGSVATLVTGLATLMGTFFYGNKK